MSIGMSLGAFADGLSQGALTGFTIGKKGDGKKDDGPLSLDKFLGNSNGSGLGATPPKDGGTGVSASGRSNTSSSSAQMGDDKQGFIAMMAPSALSASQQTGLDPRLIIAQSAVETGWGEHVPNNNYFGIKSHGKSGGNTLATTEYVNGEPVTVNDAFRGYGSPDDSTADYASFLKANPRYGDMLAAKGLEAQAAALGKSGYATDPDYGAKVLRIASGITIPSQQPQNLTMGALPPVY